MRFQYFHYDVPCLIYSHPSKNHPTYIRAHKPCFIPGGLLMNNKSNPFIIIIYMLRYIFMRIHISAVLHVYMVWGETLLKGVVKSFCVLMCIRSMFELLGRKTFLYKDFLHMYVCLRMSFHISICV